MKNIYFMLCILIVFFSQKTQSQSPGIIVRPTLGNGVTILNPNGDAYSSKTTAGFISNDINESEIPYTVVPPAISEPIGDLATGPSGGYSDIIPTVDGSGFYIFKDATNIYFRLRIGSIVSGAKGYSILIDTDLKMGATGTSADPNYVAPSGNGYGNPGFEYEVELQSNSQVAVYNIDGTATPGSPTNTYSLSTNSQISVALSTTSNNPDYFYDWAVPLSAIGNPSAIRVVATTVTSGNSALQGSRSDIYGINDANYANTPAAWKLVVNAQPAINLTSFTGVGSDCTPPPTINAPISTGSSIVVTGTWTSLDPSKPTPATISLYKNGTLVSTVSCATGNTWSITVPTVASGDVFYATAQASGESQCLQSNNVKATGCTSPPAAPVIICGSLKGISGTMPSNTSGNTIAVYMVPTTTASPTSNLVSVPITNLTYPTSTSYAFYTNGCSGGSNNVAGGMYMVLTVNGSCVSSPNFVCVSSGGGSSAGGLSTNSLTLTQPIYPGATSISGSGSASGDILRLYVNGQYQTSISATGTTFSFTGLNLNAADTMYIYSQTGTNCMTQSNKFTVSCYTAPPQITTNNTGNLLTGATTISGTSPYPGATVQLYKGTSPSGVATGTPVTVNSSGTWSVTVSALVGGDSYYATETYNGCTSASSAGVTVLTPATCPTITGSYSNADTKVIGTMPSSFTGTIRLYEDGGLIGSQTISSATAWSITVAAGTLYYGGVLTATAQASGGAESSGCTGPTVSCTSPSTPSISPTSTTIGLGQTVTYTINNGNAGTWYALLDNSGVSYATSTYQSSSSSFSMTSNSFANSGTYNLNLSANTLNGCPASTTFASVFVSGTLPINLIDFSGNSTNNQLYFYWTTSDEKNFNHFELQEDVDGYHYSTVAIIPAQSSSANVHHYEYDMSNNLKGTTPFRLMMVDNDDKQQFSKIIMLNPPVVQKPVALISPNPFIDGININYQAPNSSTLNIHLLDMYGRNLKTKLVNIVSGENQITVDNLGNLSAGTYLLVIAPLDGSEKMIYKIQRR
ncbi:MAG: T9SS type A sorting domain-containing protein [Bacteroidetes bacterium]|nr:T9SS type A sorting domain-containing protein [Bacteroidota bacterium]